VNAVLVALGLVYFVIARPLQWHWVDMAMLAGLCFYGARFLYDLVRIVRPLPAVTISDDGLRDPALGNVLIPWSAIKEIRISRVRGLGQLFLIADAERLSASPGSVAIKLANWVRGARAGRKGPDMALPMTPSAALEAPFETVLQEVRTRSSPASVAITEN